MTETQNATFEICQQTASQIKQAAKGLEPKIAVILGSGLGSLAAQIKDPIRLSYDDLPAFPTTTVEGHEGALIMGTLNGVAVACLSGRVHGYEGRGFDAMAGALRSLKMAGCEVLILTNAAGSLNLDVAPGRLMLIEDHINLLGNNPLVGSNDDRIGVRFPPLIDAWNKDLSSLMKDTASELGIDLAKGTYCAMLGPSFETPAEIKMIKMVGADAVGMSTVPECILANHCGLRVVGCSVITNFGVGMADENVSHDQTLHFADVGAQDLTNLVKAFLPKAHNWQAAQR